MVWGNTESGILIVEAPPYCLCVNWSTYRQALRPRPSIPPSFCCPPTPRVQCCSHRSHCPQRHWRWERNDAVFTRKSDRVICYFTPLPEPNCPVWAVLLQRGSTAGGRVKPSGSWGLKWPRRGLDLSAVYCQQQQQRLMTSPAGWTKLSSTGSWTAVWSSRQEVRFICFPWGINIGFLSTKR